MLTATLSALALLRFGIGRGLGIFPLLILLAVVGAIVWALTKPNPGTQPKD
jgi:uncharacterized membrane protein